jgi:hypothetical protein
VRATAVMLLVASQRQLQAGFVMMQRASYVWPPEKSRGMSGEYLERHL